MENLPQMSFHHLPPITPLLHGIGLPGPRANGHSSWLGVYLSQQITAPQLHLGCGVRIPVSVVRSYVLEPNKNSKAQRQSGS